MENTAGTKGAQADIEAVLRAELEERDSGDDVDVSERYPVVCKSKGIRARIVFSMDCWDNVVLSSVKAHRSWTESRRLRFVLERFLDSCPWPKVGEKVRFEIRALSPEGTSEETLVSVELRLADGDWNDPYLLFRRDQQE